MAEKRCYYEILGVFRDCDAAALKSAYRKLAIQYHPDRNPEDKEAEERFKECAEAYEVLSNPEKRRLYDQFGHNGLAGQGHQGFRGFEDIFAHFSDIFEDFFGFRDRHGGGLAGADLRYDLDITLEEAVFGHEADLEIPRLVACPRCQGSGAKPGTQPVPCPTCRGRGQVLHSQGFLRLAVNCPECQGLGRVVKEPCPDCRGQGRTRNLGRVKVRIPPGVEDGTRLRLRGEGEHGLKGGPPGDLYVVLHVQEHEVFERDGQNLIYHLPLNIAQAALGAEVEIPLLKEEAKRLKIPAGVQPGQTFVLRGQGVPSLRGYGRGDLVVLTEVSVPEDLTERQVELLTEFDQIEQGKKGRTKGFFRRLMGRK